MSSHRILFALLATLALRAAPAAAEAPHHRPAGQEASEHDDRDAHGIVYLDAWTLKGSRNFLTGYPTVNADGTVNVAVEIPTGTSEKWETCTSAAAADPVAFPRCAEARPGRLMVQEVKKGARRVVSYLGYPGNYGSIPRTQGADGDPLDLLAIGPALERGSVAAVKVVGVIRCIDGGDQDDKILAVAEGSPLYAKVNGFTDLNKAAINAAEIVRMWFDAYKGAKPGSGMDCSLVEDDVVAWKVIDAAAEAFQKP